MAGFMIENIETGKVKQFHHDEIDALPRDGSVTLLDTRTPAEYSRGCAEGFFNIPVDELRERLSEIPANQPVYVCLLYTSFSLLECAEGVAVMLFDRVGNFFEDYALGRSRRNIADLVTLTPDYANLLQDVYKRQVRYHYARSFPNTAENFLKQSAF